MTRSESRIAQYAILATFAAAYLFGAFPFAYFRHDDWIMVGNSTRHLNDWRFAFSPTLFFGAEEEVWFFRPMFKIIFRVFHSWFGLNYYAWLTLTLAMLAATVGLFARVIERLTASFTHGIFFAALFVASVHVHFGSLVWAGEGLMNIPQIFCSAINLYAVIRALDSHRRAPKALWLVLAFTAFVLSLGFKEAGVFQILLLVAMLFGENKTGAYPAAERVRTLLPYLVITPAYLFYRLKVLPFNPGYVPSYNAQTVLLPVAFLLGSVALPLLATLVAWVSADKGKLPAMSRRLVTHWLYAPFLLITMVPYVGHPFFSPGWLIYPGVYFILVFTLCLPKFPRPKAITLRAAGITAVIALAVVGFRLFDIGWFFWGKPEKQIVALIGEHGTPTTTRFVIEDCSNARFPKSDVRRVVGSEHGLHEIWATVQNRVPEIRIEDCRLGASRGTDDNELRLRWRFPHFELLNNYPGGKS